MLNESKKDILYLDSMKFYNYESDNSFFRKIILTFIIIK